MPTRSEEQIVASIPYLEVGGSQHLCLVQHTGSEVPPKPKLMMPWPQLGGTVLASAFTGKQVVLHTPLPAPHDRLVLPPLTQSQLQPQLVHNRDGKKLGMLLQVPGMFVWANRILMNHQSGNQNYDYASAVQMMVRESGKLMASVLNRGVIRTRNKPGIMAHALELEELAIDEIGISEQFAAKLFKQVQEKLPLDVADAWGLDGFPCHVVRFPVANRHGVQQVYLRVLEGTGHYIAINPWNLAKFLLGDRDGDALFALLRVQDLADHKDGLEIARRPRVKVRYQIPKGKSVLSLQGLKDVSTIDCEQKLKDKMVPPDLTTLEARINYIREADTRTHVAIYTMVFGWWVPRVLAASGRRGIREAYIMGHDALEWFIEACMDARKGGSPLSDPSFDAYAFMNILVRGRGRDCDLDFDELERIGVPQYAIDTLREAWEIADGNLVQYCGNSPVYRALVLGRNSMGDGVPRMLWTLRALDVKPEELYQKIVMDLAAREPITLPEA